MRLPVNGFFNQEMTYFSSFTMSLGSAKDVVINVGINPSRSVEFGKKDIVMYSTESISIENVF